MSGSTSLQTESTFFETNLSAIERRTPEFAARLRAAEPPESVRPVPGRDGLPTFQWREADGTLRWLGRTSMPTVSGPSLIEAFQPGPANVLIYSLGSGLEVKELLGRLAPYQSVFVIEPTTWAAGLALRLYDYAEEIRAGRLVLFAGDRAWEEMRGFLCEHPGYLELQRILSWPWFTPEMISEVTAQLGEINSAVAERRGEAARKVHRESGERNGLAIVSNVVDDEVFRTARLIEMAARELGLRTLRVTLDQPEMVHPDVVGSIIRAFEPAICMLPGCAPGGLAFELPSCRKFSLALQRQGPSVEWVRLLREETTLLIANEKDRSAWLSAGIEASRIDVVAPAAQPGLPRRSTSGSTGIAVHGDRSDVSAKAVGLHLASHCRLYEEVGKIIREHADSYIDEGAADMLALAEKRTGIRLENEGVRAGLIKRIREQLGPVVVRREILKRLKDAGVEFSVFGLGWAGDEEMGGHSCGGYPAPERLGDVIGQYGVTVWIGTGGEIVQPVLDAMAAGHFVLVRRHPGNEICERYGQSGQKLATFGSVNDLVTSLNRIREGRLESASAVEGLADHMQTKHTWTQRLQAIVEAGAGV